VQRLRSSSCLVENNDVAAAEADFVQGTKIRAFDAIRSRIDTLRVAVRSTQQILEDETQRIHAINLTTNTILAVVALAAADVGSDWCKAQTQLLVDLQHAKNESQQLTLALSERIDEIHQQNDRLTTAQDIVAQSMRFGDDAYKADKNLQIIQDTLNLPLVVVWFDDIYSNETVIRSAVRMPITMAQIERSVDARIINAVRTAGTSLVGHAQCVQPDNATCTRMR
jgi:hypothetical protein